MILLSSEDILNIARPQKNALQWRMLHEISLNASQRESQKAVANNQSNGRPRWMTDNTQDGDTTVMARGPSNTLTHAALAHQFNPSKVRDSPVPRTLIAATNRNKRKLARGDSTAMLGRRYGGRDVLLVNCGTLNLPTPATQNHVTYWEGKVEGRGGGW